MNSQTNQVFVSQSVNGPFAIDAKAYLTKDCAIHPTPLGVGWIAQNKNNVCRYRKHKHIMI